MPEEKLAEVAPTIAHISTRNAYHTGRPDPLQFAE